MTRRTIALWIASMLPALPLIAADGALGGPRDGKYRPSGTPAMEEAYLEPLFAENHASNLLQLKNGDTICVWFAGTKEGASDVAILLARLPKGSSQWSKPQV